MCGIAGILGEDPDKTILMQQMLDKQSHRGPDAQGMWSDEHISLGHNRLSIVDLSEAANQPMQSSCGRFVLVFNGEIYNYLELKQALDYPFQTNSDSEVLLAMYVRYGVEMLELLNGMFAFAIWDRKEKKIFAARDRFGVKPFYYAHHHDNFLFASEIKTLFVAGVNNEPNEVVWADYLVHGSYGLPDETFYKHVEQLPAGHCLQLRLGESNPTISRYYDFVKRIQNQRVYEHVKELQEDYLALLLDAIQLRFIADVPVGFNVSGGLDSSILLYLITEVKRGQTEQIEAFTFYTGDNHYDELPWVQSLIANTSSPLNNVLLKAEEVPSLIERVSYFQDEPYGGVPTLAYSKIFEAARAKGILVLLDGQGIDETWAGYDYYQTSSIQTVQGLSSPATRASAIDPVFAAQARDIHYPEPFDNALQNKQYRDLFYTKIPRALRFNDRVSMMHSTELREPFLDYRLVEMGFAQRPDMKIRDTQSKWLLRQLAQQTLGSLALAPKRTLQTPQREWLAGDLAPYVSRTLQRLGQHPWFRQKKLQETWNAYLHGKPDNSFYIWQWINTAKLLVPNA